MNKRIGLLPIEEIQEVAHNLPLEVLQDIEKRMLDWQVGGGNIDDPYMYQQSKYAKQVAAHYSE